MAITRRELRRYILRSVGDLRLLTATADSGTNVLFVDTVNLTGEVGAYNGREVLFTGGTAANLGAIRYVIGSSSTARNIQFGIPLPANVMMGDEAELVNTRGVGFRIQDVHDAINQSIASISEVGYLEPAATTDVTYTRGTAIALPPEYVTVEDVQWLDSYDATRFHTIPKSPKPNGKGWWIDHASRTLHITGNLPRLNGYPGDSTTRSVRVWGLAAPAKLYDDNDQTNINVGWLIANCQAILLKGRYYRMPTAETERLMYDSIQEARGLLPRSTARRGPFSETL